MTTAIGTWKRCLQQHRKNKAHGVRFYFKDAVASFLIRFGNPYTKNGERDCGLILNAVNNLKKPTDSLEYKMALEYLGLPKDTVLIKNRRK